MVTGDGGRGGRGGPAAPQQRERRRRTIGHVRLILIAINTQQSTTIAYHTQSILEGEDWSGVLPRGGGGHSYALACVGRPGTADRARNTIFIANCIFRMKESNRKH